MNLPADASQDQSNCPPDYYRRSNGMLHQLQTETSPNAITVDPSDINAVKAMVWDKLVTIASTMPANGQALPVLRELMDRMEGRPVQRTDSRVLTQSKGEIIIKLVDGTENQ